MRSPFPLFSRCSIAEWHRQWEPRLNDAYRAILLYHHEARCDSPKLGGISLACIFTDDEVLALADQVARAHELYAAFDARTRASYAKMVIAAEAAWVVAQQMHDRIRILLREKNRNRGVIR